MKFEEQTPNLISLFYLLIILVPILTWNCKYLFSQWQYLSTWSDDEAKGWIVELLNDYW